MKVYTRAMDEFDNVVPLHSRPYDQGLPSPSMSPEFSIHTTFSWVYPDEPVTVSSARMITIPVCPDLLDYEAIGAADNLRGRVVRAFFWLMRAWPT